MKASISCGRDPSGDQGSLARLASGSLPECNVRHVCECCSACAGISPLITDDARVRFNKKRESLTLRGVL
eukprot:1158274-Pelagomonas_calceolata.AAC.61